MTSTPGASPEVGTGEMFLAYSREDATAAATLARELDADGYSLTRDPALVEGDPFWRDAVARQVATAEALLVIWSRHAAASPWVEEELRAALGPCICVALDATPLFPGQDDPGRIQRVAPGEVAGVIRRLVRANGGPPSAEAPDAAVIEAARRELDATQARRLADFAARLPPPAALESAADEVLNPPDGSRLRWVAGRDSAGRPTGFYLGVGPVTNAQYRRFVDETGFPPAPTWSRTGFTRPDAPVTGVTWFEARAYAAWAGGDLPSEAEWAQAAGAAEYATATGAIGPALAHYGQPLGEGNPVPAGNYPPAQTGFAGMCGNTWDWCLSAWGTHRVIRGGGWLDAPLFCRIAARYRNAPVDRDCCVGFRIKRTAVAG